MVLEEKKQALSQGEMPAKPEKTSLPVKEEKKNTSGLEKDDYIPHSRAKGLLMDAKNRLFDEYGIKGKDLAKLAEESTSYGVSGPLFNQKDIKNFEKNRKEKINDIETPKEKREAKQKLEKDLKILKDVFLGEK